MKSHIALCCTAGIALAGVAAAVGAQDLDVRLDECAAIADRNLRLDCYDELADRRKRGAAARPAPAAASPATPEANAATSEELFGIEYKLNARQAQARQPDMTARVNAVQKLPGRKLIVELENGQVWEEIRAGRDLPLAAGDIVTIKRAALGSFMLITENSRATRVRRIR